MKKYINYSIVIALFIGFILALLYPINLTNFDLFTIILSFKDFLFIFIISIFLIILPLLSINLSQGLLFCEFISMGYIITIFTKYFHFKGLLFILIFILLYKLLNIFILYLNSYYSYKLIKHIYLNIFSKYKRNINNLYLYIKKVIIMSVFFLINSYIVLTLKYFTLLKIVKLLK